MSEVRIEGRLGNDPESYRNGDTNFTVLSVAENRSRWDRDKKEWIDLQTYWFDVLCFGRTGDKARMLKKGDSISLEANLKPREENIGNKKIRTISIFAKNIKKVVPITNEPIADGLPDFHSDEEINF